MSGPTSTDTARSIEERVTGLEVAVARLVAALEPSLAVSHLAAPVAIQAAKEASQHTFTAKFFALLDLGESLLKYSGALALASAISQGRPSGQAALTSFQRPVALGKWAEALRGVLDDASATAWPVEDVRRVFRRGNGKPTSTARYLLEEFIRVRNDERGHGAQQPEGAYEGLYLNHYLSVRDSLRECDFCTIPLVRIHAINRLGGEDEYSAALLMGSAPPGAPTPIRSSDRVRLGATCLWDRGSRLLDLRDFVSFRYCSKCSLEHIFFAEQIASGALSLHSYVGNHRIEIEAAAD